MAREPDPHARMSLALVERGVRRFGPGETAQLNREPR